MLLFIEFIFRAVEGSQPDNFFTYKKSITFHIVHILLRYIFDFCFQFLNFYDFKNLISVLTDLAFRDTLS